MANVTVIASGKGGVGKSTSSAFLGLALAQAGFNTLLVDCDAGMNSLSTLLRCEEDAIFNWYDVYTGGCSLRDAIQSAQEHLDLLNAPADRLDEPCVDAIAKVVEPLKNDYSYILLDAPAGLGDGLRRAAAPADSALIVATADDISVRGAYAVEQLLLECGVKESRLLINRYEVKPATKRRYLSIDAVIDAACVQLIGIVPEDREICCYSVYGRIKPGSKGLAAYSRIAKRMQGEDIPLKLSLL